MLLADRARDVLIDGCNTFSKRIESYVEGVTESHVFDASEKYLLLTSDERSSSEKFDLVGGLGSNLWSCENNYSLECVESVRLAEALRERMPYHGKYKFVKSGTDACNAAIRYARAYTKRKNIAYTGYHGWGNAFVSCTPPGLGCVNENCQKFESIELLTKFIEARPGFVAVIIEPLELELDGLTDRLARLYNACAADGCLLIYDEVITGWRVPGHTVANMTGVYPQISCLGKAIGAGYPLGVVATSDPWLTPGVFVSSTFGGEQETLRRALGMVERTSAGDILDAWKRGGEFQKWVNAIAPEICALRGYPTRFVWQCPDDETKAKIWQGLYDRGYLAGAAFFPKLSWTEKDFDKIYKAIKETIFELSTITLRGLPPRPVFKRI